MKVLESEIPSRNMKLSGGAGVKSNLTWGSSNYSLCTA